MERKDKFIYQFKITLEGIKPAIWRRIQVPENYTFWDLHVAIQIAMGWYNCHLHEFRIKDPVYGEKINIGTPDNETDDPILIEWKEKIANYFSAQNKNALYEYDFGDNWRHKITLEKILLLNPQQKYPCCLAGERACPPEDCGGIYGYQDLIKIMNNPKHEEYRSMRKWLGKKLEPEVFNIESVNFSDSKKFFKEARAMGML